MEFRILVVDDDPDMQETLQDLLSRQGYEVHLASSAEEALEKLPGFAFDLVLSDILMPGVDGMELLKTIKRSNSETAVIMITGFGEIQMAVEAMKLGAEDYIAKPFENIEMLNAVNRLCEIKRLREEALLLKQAMTRQTIPEIVGASSQIRKLLSEISTVAQSEAPVVITGESGTGKELVARAIHASSPRKQEPLVAVNAAAIPKDLLESEFFGHEKGAFSGASARKFGLFEVAHKGTLFLDEIAEMPLDLQAKLLRTVETKQFRRLGGTVEIQVDVRVISSSNRNLKEEVKQRQFREDLYFRLSTFEILIPPLRERKEDIGMLAEHYLRKTGHLNVRVSLEALEALRLYQWPGNVRELEHVLERAVLLCPDRMLGIKHLPAEIQELHRKHGKTKATPQEKISKLEDVEKEHILNIYRLCDGDKAKTAKLLGIGLKTLYRKLRLYNV